MSHSMRNGSVSNISLYKKTKQDDITPTNFTMLTNLVL